uniref:Uncharacterized protein n=1 Tax=Melopsittacus undulatus TaxID=13146 RepID=A0A8V5FJG9_MELUD
MFRKGKKRHSSSSSQSSEISTKSKSVDSSLGGLSRSSTVASLDTDSTKSSGQSNSNSDTCAEFRVKYVGAIEKLKHNESKSLEGPLDLINYIDVAQVSGLQKTIPIVSEHPTLRCISFILSCDVTSFFVTFRLTTVKELALENIKLSVSKAAPLSSIIVINWRNCTQRAVLKKQAQSKGPSFHESLLNKYPNWKLLYYLQHH